jgi:hypothetical protein
MPSLQGERGLRHPDQPTRQACIDLLASLAAQLYADEAAVQKDAPLLQQLAQRDEGTHRHMNVFYATQGCA